MRGGAAWDGSAFFVAFSGLSGSGIDLANYLKRQAKRLRTFVVDKILGVHDSPHRIALGVAIGIFVTWTPTIGFQMALTVALSALFRANKVVGVPLVWISNPATLWMYIPNYLLGCRLLGETPSTDMLLAALSKAFGVNESGLKERFMTVVQTLWDVLAPLMLGSVIIGGILGVLSYAATYKGVQVFQAKRAAAGAPPAEVPTLPSPAAEVLPSPQLPVAGPELGPAMERIAAPTDGADLPPEQSGH